MRSSIKTSTGQRRTEREMQTEHSPSLESLERFIGDDKRGASGFFNQAYRFLEETLTSWRRNRETPVVPPEGSYGNSEDDRWAFRTTKVQGDLTSFHGKDHVIFRTQGTPKPRDVVVLERYYRGGMIPPAFL